MRIKMLRTDAGPDGAKIEGRTYDVTREEGEDLVKAGTAEEVPGPVVVVDTDATCAECVVLEGAVSSLAESYEHARAQLDEAEEARSAAVLTAERNEERAVAAERERDELRAQVVDLTERLAAADKPAAEPAQADEAEKPAGKKR